MRRGFIAVLAILLAAGFASAQNLQTKADQIRAAMDARDFDSAERLVRELRISNPAGFTANNYDYLLARLNERQGRYAQATTEYLEILQRGSILAEYALWHLATSARESQDLAGERRYLTRLLGSYPSGTLSPAAHNRLIDNLFESGDYRSAIQMLRPTASARGSGHDHSSGRGGMARLGQAYMKTGDLAAARDVFTQLMAGPSDDYALAAALGLDEIDRQSQTHPDQFETLRRARIYVQNRHWADGRARFLEIIDRFPDSPNRPEALYQTGFCYYREDDQDNAIKWFERAHSEFPTKKEGEQGYYWVATALQRARKYPEATRRYMDFIHAYPASDSIEKAYRNVVDCLRYAGKDGEAIAWSDRIEQEAAGQPLSAIGVFNKARIELSRGDYQSALALLVRLQARTISPRLLGAPLPGEATFLRAYALEQLGRLDEAAGLYLAIPDERENYFGGRATLRLRALAGTDQGRLVIERMARASRDQAHQALSAGRFSEAKDAANRAIRLLGDGNASRDLLAVLRSCYSQLTAYNSVFGYHLIPIARRAVETDSGDRESPSRQALASEFIFLGLYDEGAAELRLGGVGMLSAAASRSYETKSALMASGPSGSSAPRSLRDAEYSLAVYSNRGDRADQALQFAESILGTIPRDYQVALLPRDLAEMLYPAPYKEALARFASASAVDPRLVLSLARQESRFKPAAKSTASARGLLQFIPETAQMLAEKEGLKAFDLDDLYDPHIAIRLASRYVADLSAQFPGNPYAIAASYDTSDQNVERWIYRSRSKDPDRFVAEIAIPETADYVARVMCNYWAYQQLYASDLKPQTK